MHEELGRAVLPPAVIGLLGGGQLGRMIALDGRKMGYRFQVLDPTPDAPAAQVCDHQVVGAFTDAQAARRLAEACDVVTYEFENVDAGVAQALETTTSVPQGSRLLFTTQHRVREKTALRDAGLPVTPFVAIERVEDIREAYASFDGKMVVKTCQGGYDGKGQWMVTDEAELLTNLPTWERYLEEATERGLDHPALIAEQFIPFQGEISVVVARSPRGEVAVFPPAENIHVHHILHLSMVPARFDERIVEAASEIARRVAEQLSVVGLVAVEMFVSKSGELFINELAPRPHNSGHYTMDACATSQFEQHVRAICNLPLGDTQLLSPVVMVNVLGQHVDDLLGQMVQMPGNMKVHLYGKAEAKADRKMGHVNVLASSVDEALNQIRALGIWE